MTAGALLHALHVLWLLCTHLRFLLRCSPDELAASVHAAAEARDEWTHVSVHTPEGTLLERYMRVGPAVPSGHVLVKLYRDLDGLWQESTVMAVVRLEGDGGLDLAQLRKLWNLENCYPVDSTRARVFETVIPERLSPLAVATLTENQFWLRVVEIPSLRVQNMRLCRFQCIAAYTYFLQLLYQLPALLRGLVHYLGHVMTLLQDMRDFPVASDARSRIYKSTQGGQTYEKLK